MPTPEDHPEVEIDSDVAVWLRGPAIDATDFGLENAKGGADYREYVARVLGSFARWQTPANITFLRFRHQGVASGSRSRPRATGRGRTSPSTSSVC